MEEYFIIYKQVLVAQGEEVQEEIKNNIFYIYSQYLFPNKQQDWTREWRRYQFPTSMVFHHRMPHYQELCILPIRPSLPL